LPEDLCNYSVIVLIRPRGDVNTNVEGWVAVPGNAPSCQYLSCELPKMVEPPRLFDTIAL